jgi:hypothetical protein
MRSGASKRARQWPARWIGGQAVSVWIGKDRILYQTFYAPYCRTCHSAFDALFDFYSDFKQLNNPMLGATSGADVCNGQMPHAQVPYTALAGTKLDFVEAQDLIALSFPCLVESVPIRPPVRR